MINKLALLILIFSSFAHADMTIATMPAVTIGFMTDVHYSETYSVNSAYSDDKALVAINTFNDEFGIDFVVTLGDNIYEGADAAADQTSIAQLDTAFARSTVPVYLMLGNHDIMRLTLSQWVEATDYEVSSTGYTSFDFNGYHFVFLFGNDQGGAYFNMSATQEAWLTADLLASSLKTIIFTHYNYDENYCTGTAQWPTGCTDGGACNTCYGLFPSDANVVRGIIEGDGDVIAVLQGHAHYTEDRVTGGVRYINLYQMYGNAVNTAYGVLKVYPNDSIRVEGYGNQTSY